jgi:hypothetical protein
MEFELMTCQTFAHLNKWLLFEIRKSDGQKFGILQLGFWKKIAEPKIRLIWSPWSQAQLSHGAVSFFWMFSQIQQRLILAEMFLSRDQMAHRYLCTTCLQTKNSLNQDVFLLELLFFYIFLIFLISISAENFFRQI